MSPLLAIALVAITGCGGGEVSGEPGVAEEMDTIEVTGDDANLTVSEPGGCGPHDFEPGAWNGMFSTDGNEPWLLDVTIVSFEAPKVYETSADDESGWPVSSSPTGLEPLMRAATGWVVSPSTRVAAADPLMWS